MKEKQTKKKAIPTMHIFNKCKKDTIPNVILLVANRHNDGIKVMIIPQIIASKKASVEFLKFFSRLILVV